MKKIRVLILASSSGFAAAMARDLAADPQLDVATSVFTDRDALAAIERGTADAALCDNRITGFNMRLFAQRVKASKFPIPLYLVCRADDAMADKLKMYVADVFKLPQTDTPQTHRKFAQDVALRLKGSSLGARPMSTLRYKWRPGLPFASRFQGIVAIGASAGGTEATEHLLKKLPRNMPGIVITQHMPPVFTKVYAERLNSICQLTVREAKDGENILPGVALVAPGGVQMRVQKVAGQMHPIVRCRGEERVSGHCPSVDVLFESVAGSMGSMAIGIILTGMGSDGAEGLLSMRKKGCYTIGQDESSSMVYGMPKVAFTKGAVQEQLPLDEIAQALCSHLMTRNS